MSSALISTGPRGNVERLLRGDIRVVDIRDLFFNMRESGGSGPVSEIVNFIAHPYIRTQGATWQAANHIFPIIKLWAWVELYPITTRDVPSWIQNALRANLRRVRKSVLRQWTGMNQTQASAVLERILSRQIRTAEGWLTKISIQTDEEHNVLNCAARFLKGGSLFTAHDLFEDFCRALRRQQLLAAREKETLKKAKTAVSLFALTAMHNCKIDLGDGSMARIAIARDMRGNLGIFAIAEVSKDYDGSGAWSAAFWLFETRLEVEKYCEEGVATIGRTPFVGEFEMTPQCRLGRRS